MKKLWGVALLCFLAALFLTANAAATDSGVCGDNLTWSVSAGTLTVKGTGDMYDFDSYAKQPWRESAQFTAVVIEPGVTSIGRSAFTFCGDLTKVTIPRSVTRIERTAFWGCSSLNDVTISNGVTSIGLQAFAGCTSLKNITIPNSVVTIDYHAFSGCTELTNIRIPASVTSIGTNAFGTCSSLSRIDVDNENPAYSSLDGVLFDKNQGTLHTFPGGRGGSYIIPDSVVNIGLHSFHGCNNLTSVTIPSSVIIVNSAYFASCSSLQEIKVSGDSRTHISVNGVLFDKERKVLLGYPGGRTGSYIVPSGVVEISQSAFHSCENLTGITMLNGVTTITNQAFSSCANLEKVVIPNSATKINPNVFSGCPNLKDVYYSGTPSEWNAIEGVTDLLSDSVTVHCRFDDVPSGAYYADAVNWAVSKGITNGTSETAFSPNNTCTTANIITFLWRANGSPEPKASNPFSDVQTGQYYAKAAVWAYENGMVAGTTFNGGKACTRAATMKYLWILSGRPSAASSSFSDVPSGADYAQAVSWAVSRGVTNGTSETTFSPDKACTRGQIVTFLLRYYMSE